MLTEEGEGAPGLMAVILLVKETSWQITSS